MVADSTCYHWDDGSCGWLQAEGPESSVAATALNDGTPQPDDQANWPDRGAQDHA